MTQEQSKLNECRTLIFCVQDFLARHSLSPESGQGFADARGTWCLRDCRDWLQTSDLRISSLKMFPHRCSHDKGRTFHTILSTLSELGYGVEWESA